MKSECLISLNGNWDVTGTSPMGESLNFIGKVPGCTLTDILSYEGNKDKIFYRDNARNYQKYEEYNWVYSKKFNLSELPEEAVIVFEQLDTYTDVYQSLW